MRWKACDIAIVAALCAGLATGCSQNDKDSDKDQEKAVNAAVEYQKASNSGQWKKVCELRSEGLRMGTLSACVENLGEEPKSQPEGKVTVEEVAPVSAAGGHPGGVGVLVQSSAGKHETKNAFRVILEDGSMKVDQFADIASGPVREVLKERAR